MIFFLDAFIFSICPTVIIVLLYSFDEFTYILK